MLQRLCLTLGLLFCCGISQADDWLIEAKILASSGQDAAALAQLWQHYPSRSASEQHQALLLAAELCARNGLTELARSYYLQQLKRPANSLASGDRFAIARFFADQQEWQRSISTLGKYWQNFPRELKKQARLLLGLAQLKIQQPQQALDSLRFKRHNTEALAYRRYNLAIAEYQLGKTFEARQRLHRLLKKTPHSVEQALFNDRLRLQLAQHYLRYQQGRFASPLLSPIQYQSPYANQALLMLGWAALTPGGERPKCQQLKGAQACWIETDADGKDIQRSPTSISATFAELSAAANTSKTLQTQLTTAIHSWQLLADKPATDHDSINATLAQLEAQVALAYALQSIKQHQLSLNRYQSALANINKQLVALEASPSPAPSIEKLQTLAASLQQQPQLNATVKAKALNAIDNAMQYRQQETQRQRLQQRRHWRPILLEYKKQAHLGLASLHEQMSYR